MGATEKKIKTTGCGVADRRPQQWRSTSTGRDTAFKWVCKRPAEVVQTTLQTHHDRNQDIPNYILLTTALQNPITAHYAYTLPDLAIFSETSKDFLTDDVEHDDFLEDAPKEKEHNTSFLKGLEATLNQDTPDQTYLIAKAWNALHAYNDMYVRLYTTGNGNNQTYKCLKTDDSNVQDEQIKNMLVRIRQILRPKSSENPR